MSGFRYKCENCGHINKKGGERKNYTCSQCLKKTKAILYDESNQTPEVNEQPINSNMDVVEDAEDLTFNVENKNAEFVKPVDSLEVLRSNNITPKEKINQMKNKSLAPETIGKWFEQIDKVIVKKSSPEIWDVTSKEEKNMGEAWADYLNDVLPEVDSTSGKLINAIMLTGITYTPRAFSFYEKYKEKKGRTNKKADEPKPEMSETEKESLKPKNSGEAYYPQGNKNNWV